MDILGLKKVKPDMTFDVNKMIKDTRKVMDKLDVIDTRMDRYRKMRLKEIRSKIIAKECRNNACDDNIEDALKKYIIKFETEDINKIKELEEKYEINEKNKKDNDFYKMIDDLAENKELDELYEDIMKMGDDEGKIQDLILKIRNQNSLEYELSEGLSVDESTTK
jgi:hypothetical protein